MLKLLLISNLLFTPFSVKSPAGFEVFPFGYSQALTTTDDAWEYSKWQFEDWAITIVPILTKVYYLNIQVQGKECIQTVQYAAVRSVNGYSLIINPDNAEFNTLMAFSLLQQLIMQDKENTIASLGCLA